MSCVQGSYASGDKIAPARRNRSDVDFTESDTQKGRYKNRQRQSRQ